MSTSSAAAAISGPTPPVGDASDGGAGAAVMSRAIVRDLASGARGARTMSILIIFLASSSIWAPQFGNVVLVLADWRAVFVAIIIWLAICFVLTRFMLWETASLAGKATKPLQQLIVSAKEFATTPQSVIGALLLSVMWSGFLVFLTLGNKIAIDVYDVGKEQYAFVFSGLMLPGIFGPWVNRWLIGKLGRHRTIALFLTLAGAVGIGMTALSFTEKAPAILFCPLMMIYVFTGTSLFAALTAYVIDPLPKTAGFASAILGTAQAGFGTLLVEAVEVVFQHLAVASRFDLVDDVGNGVVHLQ